MKDNWDKVDLLLEDNMLNYLGNPAPRVFESQPKNASWVSVDADLANNFSLEQTSAIDYRNAKDMASELLEFVRTVFTPELLQYVRDGTIENLSFRIGPRTIGSTDLNWDCGIEKLVYDKPAKKA